MRGLAIAIGTVVATFWGAQDRTNGWIVVGMITTVFVIGLLELIAGAANFAARRWRKRAWIDRPYALLPEERSILGNWKRPSKPPSAQTILRTLYGEQSPDRCIVACFGYPDLPEHVNDAPFEPMFITPMDRTRRDASTGIAMLLIAAAVWALSQFAIPAAFGDICVRQALFGVVPMMVIWFWCVALRPVYWRVRPQQIDVLRYGPFSEKARTRSYPIRPGTVIRFIGGPEQPRMTITMDDLTDTLHLGGLPSGTIDQIFKAISAESPSPAMPDDELLG